ncbi:methyltransferase domain-containing protein [Candidatus Giovannonibacteria bacterium]|nr:methyltransferase domain-containing protein [Candidatus Giovannonibacteria bacterium]
MLKPNKRLGQHFLKNAKILEEIADSAELTKSDTVLEVGPGTGTLTEVLAVGTKKVIAVEKDRNLIPILREKFKNTKNVEIIEGDILKLTSPLAPLLTKERGFKVVANIPYYITSKPTESPK